MAASQRRLILSGLTLLLAGLGSAHAIDGAGIRSFSVESQPSGAEVITITGSKGTTPLTLDERDIYPNSYPPEKMEQYGRLTLRKSGCREMNIRPSDSDIVNGLSLRLDCGTAASPDSADQARGETEGATAPARQAAPEPGRKDDGRASRKLEQLRFLQQLLDDGLITPEEEATIRKRILEQP